MAPGAVSGKSKVTIVGSGNWGSVAAKLIASNTLNLHSFHDQVRMWVFEETLPSGEKLSDVINRTNENVKYLPGIKLGKNVIADPDLENAVKDANMLVFVTPHQFMEGICKKLVGKVNKDVEAVSLIKGMEIAHEKLSEATVGYRENKDIAEKWVQLFTTPYFMVTAVQDVEGIELCGTLKNVVAIAAVGGRNRKVAEAFAKNGGKRSFDDLEAEMLQGQKLQVVTITNIYKVRERPILKHNSNCWLSIFESETSNGFVLVKNYNNTIPGFAIDYKFVLRIDYLIWGKELPGHFKFYRTIDTV
ncbi:hypothetical protein LWI29_032270 [Acer saccharum]|uniref:Glycerol-3-phosphate dehydrogenase NAD-dependent N-terminal domain-containing protein n=1 Tax=Acer saccharum TaxID=4024 RepID=A0AA39VU63_ACESA|nr:hypothetical protein LWI29_032270 [Acer saccharum]